MLRQWGLQMGYNPRWAAKQAGFEGMTWRRSAIMTPARAEQLALELMGQHGLLEAGWVFKWSRGKRQLGCATICEKRHRHTGAVERTKTIKLSWYLVALNHDGEVRETILHEIAHALAGLNHGHDRVWQDVCRRIGAKPERLAGEQVNVVEPRYALICGCCKQTIGKRHRRAGAFAIEKALLQNVRPIFAGHTSPPRHRDAGAGAMKAVFNCLSIVRSSADKNDGGTLKPRSGQSRLSVD